MFYSKNACMFSCNKNAQVTGDKTHLISSYFFIRQSFNKHCCKSGIVILHGGSLQITRTVSLKCPIRELKSANSKSVYHI